MVTLSELKHFAWNSPIKRSLQTNQTMYGFLICILFLSGWKQPLVLSFQPLIWTVNRCFLQSKGGNKQWFHVELQLYLFWINKNNLQWKCKIHTLYKTHLPVLSSEPGSSKLKATHSQSITSWFIEVRYSTDWCKCSAKSYIEDQWMSSGAYWLMLYFWKEKDPMVRPPKAPFHPNIS